MVLAAPVLARFEGVLISHDEDLTQLKRTVAQRIAARLADLNITQGELQARTGIDQAQLSRYANATSAPTISTVIKLARALDCTAGYLIGQEDEPKPLPQIMEYDLDPLSGLSDDELFILTQYRNRRAALQEEVVNEGVAVLANPLRDTIRGIIARVLHEQGKFDTRRNNP